MNKSGVAKVMGWGATGLHLFDWPRRDTHPYQMARFKSHHVEIAQLLSKASPEERNLPENVKEGFLLSALHGETSRLASRELVYRFYENRPRDPMAYNFVIATWELSTWLFYSENERLWIIAGTDSESRRHRRVQQHGAKDIGSGIVRTVF